MQVCKRHLHLYSTDKPIGLSTGSHNMLLQQNLHTQCVHPKTGGRTAEHECDWPRQQDVLGSDMHIPCWSAWPAVQTNSDIGSSISLLAETGPFTIPVQCLIKRAVLAVQPQVSPTTAYPVQPPLLCHAHSIDAPRLLLL